MWVISMKRLREFWKDHPDAEKPLRAWYRTAEKAGWTNIKDARKEFPHADAVTLYCGLTVTIFNIRGNNYRLATVIEYEYFRVYVKTVLTHREYDSEKWKVSLCNE